jgi:predicted amidohydrolase YtcJ
VVTGARVWTGDSQRPEAAAVAITGDRIVDVGTERDIEPWRGSSTTVIDAEGRRVVPGFNDRRVHVLEGGTTLDNVALQDADSPEEFARRIGERAKARRGEWILGGSWDNRRWAPAQLPTRFLVDELTNGTPVFVTRYDGRAALANSTVLGRAGIGEGTPDPKGGRIVRDAHGYPTGVLEGAAMGLVRLVVPDMTPAQRTRALERALEHAASLGVTTLQDVRSSREDVALFADFRNRGRLTARIDSSLPRHGGTSKGTHPDFGSDWPRGPLSPFVGLQAAAVTGAMTMTEAMTAYTAGSAEAESREADKGTIARGQLADLVILSDDIFALPPARLREVSVLTTIVGGRVVHRRKP